MPRHATSRTRMLARVALCTVTLLSRRPCSSFQESNSPGKSRVARRKRTYPRPPSGEREPVAPVVHNTPRAPRGADLCVGHPLGSRLQHIARLVRKARAAPAPKLKIVRVGQRLEAGLHKIWRVAKRRCCIPANCQVAAKHQPEILRVPDTPQRKPGGCRELPGPSPPCAPPPRRPCQRTAMALLRESAGVRRPWQWSPVRPPRTTARWAPPATRGHKPRSASPTRAQTTTCPFVPFCFRRRAEAPHLPHVIPGVRNTALRLHNIGLAGVGLPVRHAHRAAVLDPKRRGLCRVAKNHLPRSAYQADVHTHQGSLAWPAALHGQICRAHVSYREALAPLPHDARVVQEAQCQQLRAALLRPMEGLLLPGPQRAKLPNVVDAHLLNEQVAGGVVEEGVGRHQRHDASVRKATLPAMHFRHQVIGACAPAVLDGFRNLHTLR
jgi:hypothetical protein